MQVAKGTQGWEISSCQGDTQPRVYGTGTGQSTVVDAVRGGIRGLRLVSSWAQRAGARPLCQQGGMAAGPCGVRPLGGAETVTGLGLRL